MPFHLKFDNNDFKTYTLLTKRRRLGGKDTAKMAALQTALGKS